MADSRANHLVLDPKRNHPSHDWQKEDGNFGDTIERCQRCGIHAYTPRSAWKCQEAAHPIKALLDAGWIYKGGGIYVFTAQTTGRDLSGPYGKQLMARYEEVLREAGLERAP